ncbi:MAG: molybdopterin-dependent oxidoreductase [Bryobacteraceae bacterium]|nr:molybdopterin-dependent oxidoreductase [Bryobacteraceae bacterium]
MSVESVIPRQIEELLSSHRRNFLKSAGLFAVSLATPGVAQTNPPPGPYRDPDFRQLDSWIVIHQDNTATFYVGKTDPGQGTGTSFRQLMADELDIAFNRTACIMGSTDITVNQGGSGGSTALEYDSRPMRRAAAEARRVLLEMASARLGAPVDQLAVHDAVISLQADPSKRVSYGELIAGKRFNVTLTGNNVMSATGLAKVKPVQQLKYTGQSLQRDDIPAKVDGSLKWAGDVKLPGMVHARNVKPPYAGAKLLSVDEASVRGLPGFVRVLSKGNYVAVVFEREEQAIEGARQLKTSWEKPAAAPFPRSEDLFEYMRAAVPTSKSAPVVEGDPDTSFTSAALKVEAEYEIPFQGHTSFSGAVATADPSNGQMTIYSNDMKSYSMRTCVADFLGLHRDRVRVVWMQGAPSFGRSACEDAACEAAWLAKEIARPVRMQWMRDEETAWDTKGPAYLIKMRGALDAQRALTAYEYNARACDYNHTGYNEPDSVLIAHLMGIRRKTPAPGRASMPSDVYAIPHRRMLGEVVGLPLIWETPLRTGNLRDPDGPQVTFASESFIDELALAAKADPLEFRLQLLGASAREDSGFRRARSLAVLQAAAAKFGWEKRVGPKPRGKGQVLTGRGVAYSFRGQSVVAQMAEVEVNRETGHVWAKRMVCAYDCGLVVNPEGLRRVAECGMLHSLSRALHEEVMFDTEKVTSRDWISHPTLRHADVPETIDVLLVNGDPQPDRPDLSPYGGGEATCKPTLAAIANAIFDATGVRLRRVPFRAARVLAALKAAGVDRV